ncbi:MAG: glutathione S-transferase N-terminal domain-containing protein [Alphaproteobacteria bacterium]
MSAKRPIVLYYWPTPNGQKVSIMLEELGVPYELRFVNIGKGDQFDPDFLHISPNNRIPAVTDPDGPDGQPISMFESGAILMYLGDKYGRFYPRDVRARSTVNEWLCWQIGGVGPIFGQNHHFYRYAVEKVPYAIKRFVDETHRLYRVLDERLEGRAYVADAYSIADMALIGWVRNAKRRAVDVEAFPNVMAWTERMIARPAVATALAIEGPETLDIASDEEARKILFGQK